MSMTPPLVLLVLLLLHWFAALPASASGQTCLRQLSSCACETADGVIDLAPLSSPSGYPFSDSTSGGQDTFQWSPCVGQLCGSQFDTAVCETYGSTKLPVGQSDSAKFVTHPTRGLQLVYTDSRSAVLYTSYVVLVCDPKADPPTFSTEGGIYELYMHLRSKYACPSGGQNPGGSASGISTGDVLCIVLAMCIVLYLAGGLLLNKFWLGKEGSDALPNKDFWVALPGYVKDGCLFTVGRLRCGGGVSQGYEAV